MYIVGTSGEGSKEMGCCWRQGKTGEDGGGGGVKYCNYYPIDFHWCDREEWAGGVRLLCQCPLSGREPLATDREAGGERQTEGRERQREPDQRREGDPESEDPVIQCTGSFIVEAFHSFIFAVNVLIPLDLLTCTT